MQWIIGVFWGIGVVLCAHSTRLIQPFRILMACGLGISMLLQLWLLKLDNMLTLETALPLHLCGLFGVLSILMLWYAPKPLWELSAYLAAPAAFITLFFPAVIPCTHPKLMAFAFYQLHVLVALTPVFLTCTGKPLPKRPQRAFVLGNGYLLFISAFNCAFQTNYLFLSAAPVHTPLALLFSRGRLFYVCALEMLCMLIFSCLQGLYCQLSMKHALLMAGNS
ncbi:MAG: YwaF family protein [Clostridia bacterium]|nr:YwaF family protein [Clostridia bacterium]